MNVVNAFAGSGVLRVDPRLAWLAAGAAPQPPQGQGAQPVLEATRPWYRKAASRKAFLSRLLVQLISGKLASIVVE